MASALSILSLVLLIGAAPGEDGRWRAGGYSFSDEMGGFAIRDIAGAGTRDDPVVLTQELQSASPVVLVIRATGALRPYAGDRGSANGFLYLRLRTVNASALAWVEFAFELQEILGRASVYGDGLSFDQRRRGGAAIRASDFAGHERAFEPHDRLLFRDGHVDPGATTLFDFPITDLTPRREFYLVQDPRIPFS